MRWTGRAAGGGAVPSAAGAQEADKNRLCGGKNLIKVGLRGKRREMETANIENCQ